MALPLGASDFASACLTASVPRESLLLVILRVVSVGANGHVDVPSCQSASFLFDRRHTLGALGKAVDSTMVSIQRYTPKARLYVRMGFSTEKPFSSGAGQRTVAQEMSEEDGTLRDAVHVSGALRAWQRHASVRSVVCVNSAVSAYRQWTASPSRVHYPLVVMKGIEKLTGAGKPTTTVPAACSCASSAGCDCFMRRAMYRAGTTWITLYVVLPPFSPPIMQRGRGWERGFETAEWIRRMIDGTPSESDTEGSRGDVSAMHPLQEWPVECPSLEPLLRECASEDGSEFEHVGGRATLQLGLVELAVQWALRMPRTQASRMLTTAADALGPYHGPPLRRSVSEWARILSASRALDRVGPSPSEIYRIARSQNTAATSLGALITSLWPPSEHGPAVAALVLLLFCLDTHIKTTTSNAETSARGVNNWTTYTAFEPPEILTKSH